MKRYLACIAFFCCSISVFGQSGIRIGPSFFSHAWNRGIVYFNTGDTLKCNLRFNQSGVVAILQVLIKGQELTVAPVEISGFEYFDEERFRHRRFLSVRVDADDEQQEFLETIYSNRNVLLLNHRTRGVKHKYQQYMGPISKPGAINKKYIFHVRSRKLLPMSRHNLLQVVADKPKEVEAFIESNHFRFKKTVDYVKVLRFHASL